VVLAAFTTRPESASLDGATATVEPEDDPFLLI
jgi:hypothetical protein